MTDQKNNIANFAIESTPVAEQSSSLACESDEQDVRHFFLDDRVFESTSENLSYSNNEVKKAGRKLRKNEGDLKSATKIIEKFRAAHKEPLNAICDLIQQCCSRLYLNVKPVSRLKRLETIIDKLKRKSLDGVTPNAICVTNMNDIGGCRIILPNLENLHNLKNQLQSPDYQHESITIKDISDYTINPKPNDCGYRSLHMIYQYRHANGKKFNVEVQLRTHHQHLWATAVEIIDILERTRIKTHSHSPSEEKSSHQIKWEELLSIMSQYIASKEGVIQLNDIQKNKFSNRLIALANEIDAIKKLETFNIVQEEVKACCNESAEHILLVVYDRKLILTRSFENYNQAVSTYNELETFIRGYTGMHQESQHNTLIVSTEDLESLAEAYPNYLGDCSRFIKLLTEAMNGIL